MLGAPGAPTNASATAGGARGAPFKCKEKKCHLGSVTSAPSLIPQPPGATMAETRGHSRFDECL